MPNDIERKLTVTDEGSGTLKQAAADADRLSKATDEQGKAADQAATADQRRNQQLDAKRQRLVELQRREVNLERSVQKGTITAEQAAETSRRRQRRIDRLSRSLAVEEDRQAQVNRRVHESVQTHRQFDASGATVERRTGGMSAGMLSLQNQIGAVTGGFSSLAGSLTVGGGIALLMQGIADATEAVNERLEENVRLTNEAAQATLNLHALNLTFNQGDEDLVTSFSNASGRDFAESARLLTNFRSATAALSREEQDKLFIEGLLPLAIANSGDIDPIAKFIGRISPITQDPTEIKNIIGLGVNLAGEVDPAQFLGNAGELLGPGDDAGLSPAETLSLLSFASGKVETSRARTQLRNILSRFTDDPDTRSQLSDLGISDDAGFFEQVQGLSDAGATGEQLVNLVGIENKEILSRLVGEIETVQRFRADTVAAAGEGDLFGEFIQELHEESPRHRQRLELAQLEQIERNERSNDTDAQTIARARRVVSLQLDRAVRERVLSTSAKKSRLETFDSLTGSPDFLRRVRGDIFAGVIEPVAGQDISGSIAGIDLDSITAEQIAESAAGVIESDGFFTDLLPGGNSSTEVEVSDFVRDTLRRDGGGNVLIEQQTIIRGTQINNSTDPSTGDRELPRGERP